MNGKFRIALAQINPIVGALEYNLDKILKNIQGAKKSSADIVFFPELALCGYPPEDLLLKEHFIKDAHKLLSEIASVSHDIVVVLGTVERCDNRLYNAAVFFANSKLSSVYHKQELPNYGVFDEKRYFSKGSNGSVYKVGEACFAVNICEDIWKDNGICAQQVESGANLVVNLSASPYHVGKSLEREGLIKKRAEQNGVYFAYLNMVGAQDELVFDGASFVVAPNGKVMASANCMEEDLLFVDLPLSELRLNDKVSELNVVDLKVDLLNDKPNLFLKSIPKVEPPEEIYRALILGTRDYVIKNGFEKVVLGLSGGIDSALVASIACDALGSENVIGVSMPSRYSSEGTKNDAEKLAKNLGIAFHTIPIEPIFTAYENALSGMFKKCEPDLTEENIQARVRGNLLMALSNKFGWMLLTTGNKSENAVGYCTLYGDMAGGFAVIKDVAKMTVFDLCRYRNEKAGQELIPNTIILRAPSAELRDNQKDEDSLPPYSELDSILEKYVEQDKSFDAICADNHDIQTVKRVLKLVDRNEYKRRQSPPGIKITPKSFGKDRRLPITHWYTFVS